MRYINPELEGIHPLRLELSDDELDKILVGIDKNEDWMTLEEIEAAADYVFDHITMTTQTHPGEVIVQ